jgi:Arc/MetJ family transcription regulator
MYMKTSLDIDRELARQAQSVLGTSTMRETVDAALREVVQVQKRLDLIGLLADDERFDFEDVERAWGGDH